MLLALLSLACSGASDVNSSPGTPDPGPVIQSIFIQPQRATLDAGQVATFSAHGVTAAGDTIPVSVTWASEGGTISPAGVYRAGTTEGDFRLYALHVQRGMVDTASVTIQRRPQSTPALLFSEDFENTAFVGTGWYDNTSLTTSTVEHVAGSTRSLEVKFNQGAKTPTLGGSARHLFTGSESVYLSYWVKYSPNWVGSGVNYHPHEFHFVTTEDGQYVGPSVTHLTAYVEHNYKNGGYPVLAFQDALNIDAARINVDLSRVTERRAAHGCNGNSDGFTTDCYVLNSQYRNGKTFKTTVPYFMPSAGVGYKSDWHHVEAYFKLNSIVNGVGQPNGVAQYWFDGALVIDHQNVLLRTGAHPTMKFNQFLIAPYIGAGSPVTQTMWVDNLEVMTARP